MYMHTWIHLTVHKEKVYIASQLDVRLLFIITLFMRIVEKGLFSLGFLYSSFLQLVVNEQGIRELAWNLLRYKGTPHTFMETVFFPAMDSIAKSLCLFSTQKRICFNLIVNTAV
ncbi:hypothetical protein ACJX0J_009675, partial [Zea mays]